MYDIYDELAEEFEKRGYQWKKEDGTFFTPTADQIKVAVDKSIGDLYSGEPGQLMIGGHLIVQRGDNNKTFYVYLHIGETK